MRQNPHVRICGGPGSATTLVYPTACRDQRRGHSASGWRGNGLVLDLVASPRSCSSLRPGLPALPAMVERNSLTPGGEPGA